jgi:hypothetical protein
MSLINPRHRDILDFPGYTVSEEGEVLSWVFRGRTLTVPRRVTPYLSKNGRWCVRLMRDRKQEVRSLANLMLYAFRGAPPPGTQLRPNGAAEAEFIDGNPHNLKLSHLRWNSPYQDPNP